MNAVIEERLSVGTTRVERPPALFSRREEADSLAWPVMVLVLWLTCLAVGLLGFVLPYARPNAKPAEEPFVAQKLEVELTPQDIQLEELPPDPGSPPLPSEAVAPPQPRTPIAVAEPGPAVAFAIPVERAASIVEANRASYTRPETRAAAVTPLPQTLAYGQGEGKQPAPEYPRQAIREGQEGVVGVRMVVGEDGRVVSVEAFQPSAWSLLNESAIKTVRHRWRFRPGALRVYDVSIRFEL